MTAARAEQCQDGVLAWLSRLPLSELSRQAVAEAFEAVGIEELSDLAAVDEEVLDALEVELCNWGITSTEAKDLSQALTKSGLLMSWSENHSHDSYALFTDDSCYQTPLLEETEPYTGGQSLAPTLPYKSPMAAYFDGHNSFMPPSPESASNVSSCPELFRSVSNSSVDSTNECPVGVHSTCAAASPNHIPEPSFPMKVAIPDSRHNLVVAASWPTVERAAHSGSEHHDLSRNKVTGYVWNLSQDPKGSRDVQRAIEEADSNEEREALVREMQGHVCAAMQCPHANHVMQKCVSILEPCTLQFMIDELVREGPKMICNLAHHRYGCRVLERLLLRCASNQLSKIVASLLADAANLSMHRYGNFVMQRLLEHRDWHNGAIGALEAHIWEVGHSFFGSHVLGHALRQEALVGGAKLARAIVSRPKLLAELRRLRHGAPLVEQALQNILSER